MSTWADTSSWGRQVVNNGQNMVNVIKERPYNGVVPGGAGGAIWQIS